jgi:RNA polymerase sigma factor (sigma-70 family)
LDDQELMVRIRDGDQNSYIELVNSYKKKIIALCYSYTEDSYEAEDLSQDVLVTFYKNIVKFRGECSVSTYLYKIAVSKCIDFKRKRTIKAMLFDGFYSEKEKSEDLDEKIYIRQCISKLPKNIKTPIVLYYYVGLDQKEIGEILNISSRAVEGRIYRGKQILRNMFSKEGNIYAEKVGLHR